MKVNDLKQCTFPLWYPQFKKVTIKSRIIPLPSDFISYLLKDGCFLPKSSQFGASKHLTLEEDCENVAPDEQGPEFPHLERIVSKNIEQLGGKIFPKLNWSSPKDATWMSCDGTVACRNFGDICLFLKSSQFVTHDLLKPFASCSDTEEVVSQALEELQQSYVLVLREWLEDMRPDAQFRCFVRMQQLVGVSQRQDDQFFPYLGQEKDKILDEILVFYESNIRDKFPLHDYAFDVYRESPQKMILVDFNPFGEITDSLLFTWDELNGEELLTHARPIIRVLESNTGIRPSSYQQYGISEDLIHLAQTGDAYKLLESIRLTQGQDSSDSDSVENVA